MPGVYDGAEVLLWVNMAEPVAAQSVYGTANAAFTVTLNNAGANGSGLTNAIRFAIATPAGSGVNVVSVAYSAGNIDITLTPPSTGADATAAKAVAAINASPAAKYYVTASLPAASTGASPIAAAIAIGYVGVNGATNTAGADAGTANFAPVARQQGTDFDDSMDTIDAVSKGDRFALQLAGRQSGSFELSGLHSFEDTTQERVRRAYQRRELVLFRRIFPGTVAGSAVVHEANCRVTGFSLSEPDSDVATFSAPVSMQENWRVV